MRLLVTERKPSFAPNPGYAHHRVPVSRAVPERTPQRVVVVEADHLSAFSRPVLRQAGIGCTGRTVLTIEIDGPENVSMASSL